MRNLAAMLILMLMVSPSAWAGQGSYLSGNQLLEKCRYSQLSGGEQTPQQLMKSSECLGYVAGAIDMLGVAESICAPAQMSRSQAAAVVLRWMEHNPELRHYSGSWVVFTAIAEAYPCQ